MKIASKTMLRFLIVAEIAFLVMAGASELILEKTLPMEIHEYKDRIIEAELTLDQVFGLCLGPILFVGVVIAWIGLWRLWTPARFIYTVCRLLGVLLYLLLDRVYYRTPLGAIFGEFSVLAAGMILGLAYFSGDLATHFTKGFYRPSGIVGGILLGAAMSNILAMTIAGQCTGGGTVVSAVLGIAGAFMIALHVAKGKEEGERISS